MSDLRKAAQDVLELLDKSGRGYVPKDMGEQKVEALREALQADGIGDAVQESHMQDEPSIDALIAEIDGAIKRAESCVLPWDTEEPTVHCYTLKYILDKYKGVK